MLTVVFLSRNSGSFSFELTAQLHIFSIIGTVKTPFANDVIAPFLKVEWGQISFRYSETDR